MGAAASMKYMDRTALAAEAERADVHPAVCAKIRDEHIDGQTALEYKQLSEDDATALAKELFPESIAARGKFKAALKQFKRAVEEGEDGTESKHTLEDAAREEKEAAPAAIDPDAARRFLAAVQDVEPWSCAGPEQLSPWWEGTVVRQLGDWNKKDQKPTLRALARVFVDGPTILARCCDEIDKAPFMKLRHAPDGTKLDITFGLKDKLTTLLCEHGLGFYYVGRAASRAFPLPPPPPLHHPPPPPLAGSRSSFTPSSPPPRFLHRR